MQLTGEGYIGCTIKQLPEDQHIEAAAQTAQWFFGVVQAGAPSSSCARLK